MDCQHILRKLNDNEYTSILTDIQQLLSNDETGCSEVCTILRAIYRAIVPSSVDLETKDYQAEVFNLLPSINLCIDHARFSYTTADLIKYNFFPLLYHIIRTFLKVELYNPGISTSDILKDMLADTENNFKDKVAYIQNMSIIFWNEACQIDTDSKTIDPNISFILRTASIRFSLLGAVDSDAIIKNANLSLSQYCQKNKNPDVEQIKKILQDIWSYLESIDSSYKHRAHLFEILCTWFKTVMNHLTEVSITEQFLNWLEYLVNTRDKKKEKQLLNICSGLSKLCIQFFILQENNKNFKKICAQYSDFCRKYDQWNDTELKILTHSLQIIYTCFSKMFQAVINGKNDDLLATVKSGMAVSVELGQFYVEMSSKATENKEQMVSTKIKMYLCHNLLNLFFSLIKKETNTSRKSQLIKESKDFVKFLHSNFACLTEIEKESKSIISLGTIMIHIGQALYSANLYSECIYYLEVGRDFIAMCSSSPEYNSPNPQNTLWKMHEVLAFAQYLSGSHDKALLAVVQALTKHKDKTKECFNIWRRVKKDAIWNVNSSVIDRTIADYLSQINPAIELEEKISFLLEELKICRSEKCNFDDETIAVLKKLLELECPKSVRAYVLLEIITMPVTISEKMSLHLNNSLPEMSIEAIKLYNEHLSIHPNDDSSKLHLSLVYFWVYHENLKKIHNFAEKEAQNIFELAKSKPKTDSQKDVEEENEICDIQPTHPLVCLSVEEETLKNLDLANQLWDDILNWQDVASIVENKMILDVIQATAEIYGSAVRETKELKLLLLLRNVSQILGSRLHEHTSYVSLINLLIKLGYLNMAFYFLKLAEKSSNNLSSFELEVTEVKLKLAKSNYMLHTGKFDEGLNLLEEVLKCPTLEKSFKSIKILNIEALLLLSKYLSLPAKAFSTSSDCLKTGYYLAPIIESTSICKSVMKHLSEKQATMNSFDWLCFKPLLLRYLLQTHLLLGELYFKAGEPRFARCYLQDALIIAESHIFTYWSSKILLTLGHIDLLCDNFKDCQVKTSGLKYILGNEKRNSLEILSQIQSKYSSPKLQDPMSPDSPSDLIIYSVPEISIAMCIKQTYIDKVDIMSSPVSKRLAKNRSDNASSINKFVISFSTSLLQLQSLFLVSLLPKADISINEPEITWQELLDQFHNLRNPDNFRPILTSIKLTGKIKDSLLRVPSRCETLLCTTIMLQMIQSYCLKNEISKAKDTVHLAYCFLKKSPHPNYLYPDVYAVLRYHDIRISLCQFLKISPNSSMAYQLCPSVKSNLSVKKNSSKKTILGDGLNTPVSRNIPKIAISKAKKCNAPLKKNLLNTNLKKDIGVASVTDSSVKSVSPCLIFSSSDEENFESPLVSFTRASKSRPKRSKKNSQGTSDRRYQFFKSKNESLGVKSASDIWKLALANTPTSSKENRKLRSHISERKLSIEHARCSPIVNRVQRKQKSKNSKNSHHLGVKEDFSSDSVFFSPIKNVPVTITNLIEDVCKGLSSLTLSKSPVSSAITYENLKDIIEELSDLRLLIRNIMPFPLYSDICRLLAVLTLIEPTDLQKTYNCSYLLSETFSVSLRNVHLANLLYFKESELVHESSVLLQTLKKSDCDIKMQMELLLELIPADWTVVQVTALHDEEYLGKTNQIPCPTKLILCQYQKDSNPLVIATDCSSDEGFSSSFLAEFDSILQENTLTMLNKDCKLWWNTRSSLDSRLKDLIKCLENIWLGCWKGLFLGVPKNEARINQLQNTVDTICKSSPCSDKKLLQIVIDSAKYMSREQVSAAVSYLWNFSFEEEEHKNLCQSLKNISISLPETERHHVILILDQSIQALPWECLPILSGMSVSRMPSLSLLHTKLALLKSESVLTNGIDTKNTYYLLNPGGDLTHSQECFEKRFEKQKGWKGLCASAPTAKEHISAFKDYELFIYCGHGSGRQYFENVTVGKLQLQATSIIMGCGSGRLKRLGRVLEAYGIVLKLLLSGCPSITANLWDVTDKDIDRFTDRLLQSFIPYYEEIQGTPHDIAKAVSVARNACRLRYLVGAAPVVYGFPVFAKDK